MENLQPMYSNIYGKIEQREPDKEPHNAGEQELKDWFRSQGHYVIDVSDNPQFWDKDIDLLVTHKDTIEEPTTIEVKWDTKIAKTGNLFLEHNQVKIDTWGYEQEKEDGWFRFCKAGLLFYGDAVNKCYYVFKFKELKDYVFKHKNNWREGMAKDYYFWGDLRKVSFGWLVPLEELKKNVGYQVLRL